MLKFVTNGDRVSKYIRLKNIQNYYANHIIIREKTQISNIVYLILLGLYYLISLTLSEKLYFCCQCSTIEKYAILWKV